MFYGVKPTLEESKPLTITYLHSLKYPASFNRIVTRNKHETTKFHASKLNMSMHSGSYYLSGQGAMLQRVVMRDLN